MFNCHFWKKTVAGGDVMFDRNEVIKEAYIDHIRALEKRVDMTRQIIISNLSEEDADQVLQRIDQWENIITKMRDSYRELLTALEENNMEEVARLHMLSIRLSDFITKDAQEYGNELGKIALDNIPEEQIQ